MRGVVFAALFEFAGSAVVLAAVLGLDVAGAAHALTVWVGAL